MKFKTDKQIKRQIDTTTFWIRFNFVASIFNLLVGGIFYTPAFFLALFHLILECTFIIHREILISRMETRNWMTNKIVQHILKQ